MKHIIVAESAGFCAGVARSVRIAEETLAKYGEAWCIGELIHNHDEVVRLENLGLKTAMSANDVPNDSVVVIRSHGEPKSVYDVLAARGCTIVDATCGRVERIHQIAEDTGKTGGHLIVFGDRNHPEVVGICGWCESCSVVSSPEE